MTKLWKMFSIYFFFSIFTCFRPAPPYTEVWVGVGCHYLNICMIIAYPMSDKANLGCTLSTVSIRLLTSLSWNAFSALGSMVPIMGGGLEEMSLFEYFCVIIAYPVSDKANLGCTLNTVSIRLLASLSRNAFSALGSMIPIMGEEGIVVIVYPRSDKANLGCTLNTVSIRPLSYLKTLGKLSLHWDPYKTRGS